MNNYSIAPLLLATIFSLCSLLAGSARAAMPNPELYPPGSLRRALVPHRTTSIATRKGQVAGVAKLLVLRIDFTDQQAAAERDYNYFNSMIFATDAASVSDFFYRNSNGLFQLEGLVSTGWVRSEHHMGYYGKDENVIHGSSLDSGEAGTPVAIYQLAREAVELYDNQVDYNDFDQDNDGIIDHIMIIHAGAGQENSRADDAIWSHRWDYGSHEDSTFMTTDGVALNGYTMVSEESLMGILAHEFAHDLGIPDLYNTENGQSAVGEWCLMDIGSWSNPPALLSAWCKELMGWETPTRLDSDQAVTLGSINDNRGGLLRIDIGPEEYFLLENRSQSNYGQALPSPGMLIWHIDNNIGDFAANNVNNNSDHLRVALEPASYKLKLELSPSYISGQTPLQVELESRVTASWPDRLFGTNKTPWQQHLTGFSPYSVPNTANNSSEHTGINITSISTLANGDISFELQLGSLDSTRLGYDYYWATSDQPDHDTTGLVWSKGHDTFNTTLLWGGNYAVWNKIKYNDTHVNAETVIFADGPLQPTTTTSTTSSSSKDNLGCFVATTAASHEPSCQELWHAAITKFATLF